MLMSVGRERRDPTKMGRRVLTHPRPAEKPRAIRTFTMSIDLASVDVQYPACEPLPADLDTWEPSEIDRAWWAEHCIEPEPYDEALELADICDEDLDLAEMHQDWLDARRMLRLETGLSDADCCPGLIG
jgi:hypothetical protein